MANEEQLSILKQGVEAWNRWRDKNPDVYIDLREARLRGADLQGANLRGANLLEANLREADLSKTYLQDAHLNLAKLSGADLTGARLIWADFIEADLVEADLRRAVLVGTDLREAHLRASNFTKAVISRANFGNSDMSGVIGLENVVHGGPSNISTSTFALSKGKIPEVFLRGCGLSDWEIEMVKLYNPDLNNEGRNRVLYKVYDLQASQAIQISPLFISYSHGDGKFVDKLESRLNKRGVRFWRDVHDATAGRLEKVIDRAMRLNPTVLLILSTSAFKSDWVEHEVRAARELEKEMVRDVLCPIALDDSWKNSRWPKRVMEQIMEYNILDFSAWRDESKFGTTFNKLIDGLELFYKG